MPKDILVNWDKLPEIRINPLTGQSVIICAQRGLKVKKEKEVVAYRNLPRHSNSCPFCLGNEEQTPQELIRIGVNGHWKVRGFPNLFPFLQIEDGGERPSHHSCFFRRFIKKGIGAHELIVESPKHNACFSQLSISQITNVFKALCQRYQDLKRDSRFRYFYAFKNYGYGSSQDHPHWQLEARAFLPKAIWDKIQIIEEYRMEFKKCLVCHNLEEEKKAGRVILETGCFSAFVPFAPSELFEVVILPKKHIANFTLQLQEEKIAKEFAWITREALRRIKKALQEKSLGDDWQKASDPPYVICLFTAPYNEEKGPFHWYLDLLPQTTEKVGHERGTREDVIPAMPEEMAEILKTS